MWGWGKHPVVEAELLSAQARADVVAAVAAGPLTPRGLGRSYGDSSLGDRVLDLTRLDSFVAFDEATGAVTVEAGVSLSEVLRVLLPRGWFLPVTPGTRYVTVGGAIASDIHGKNHHKDGTFTDHVSSFELLVASGEVLTVSRTSHPDLFAATCGGMGLTGVVLEATFTMRPVGSGDVVETVVKAPDLDAALEAFAARADATYSVAWVDLLASGARLGRSLVMTGEHADDGPLTTDGSEPRATVPLDMPSVLLNPLSVRAFNHLYYARVRQPQLTHRVGHQPFFYPLDTVAEWNRLYGRRGFLQYQLAIPFGDGPALVREILRVVAAAGLASPLAVLKVFGPGNSHLLSFPVEGYTLALDLQATPRAFEVADRLDRLVLAAGGRLYLAKDARMSEETFRASYPRIEEFEAVRRRYGADGVFVSTQSRRLGLA
ncbi:MAG: FAD-linked oxidase [Nocardioides sp.]|nr:FAD-linked oxidase [Nocardioides sp.]